MPATPTPTPAPPSDPGPPPPIIGAGSSGAGSGSGLAAGATAGVTAGVSGAGGASMNPPNRGANNTPSETAVARTVRQLIEDLMAGRKRWAELSAAQREQVIIAIGLDPASNPTPEQIRSAAALYLQSPPDLSGAISGSQPPAAGIEIQTPNITGVQSQEDPWAQALTDLYVSLWGEPPPQRWLENALNSGMNLFEIELQERSKPAWMHTKRAQDEYAAKAAALAQALGLR